MRPARSRRLSCLLIAVLALAAPTAHAADETTSDKLDWETGKGKSYLIPALEVGGFLFGLNQFDRRFLDDSRDYESNLGTAWKNFRTVPEFDRDPFSVNQIGHPYQGNIYYGIARSTGLKYWESLLYGLAGSFLWETAGETTPPSLNDHVTTAIGGSFLGETMFRMASLLLEGGGEEPGVWRELGAALISPPLGVNRLVFGDRFKAVFPSRDPAVAIRLRLGATQTTGVATGGLTSNVKNQEGMIDFAMAYGLPGKPGYRYSRPFDHFLFQFTAVPNALDVPNAIENATIRGLLVGTTYGSGDDDYRGVWGLFGGYDYLSPQIFRLSNTNVSLGTTGQWWLTRSLALQGTALAGLGFGAAGTVADKDELDYHYGVIPQALVGLRLVYADRVMLEGAGREYFVIGTSASRLNKENIGSELISRASVGVTVRVHGPHGVSAQYVVSSRDVGSPGHKHQSIETVSLSYTFLGRTGFGAVEWRPAELAGR